MPNINIIFTLLIWAYVLYGFIYFGKKYFLVDDKWLYNNTQVFALLQNIDDTPKAEVNYREIFLNISIIQLEA
jgi:hypothetical protein